MVDQNSDTEINNGFLEEATRRLVDIDESIASPSRIICDKVLRLNQEYVISIGSSTGGIEALQDLLTVLPKDIPPIIVAQHIPPMFSTAFAKRLDELCPFEVKEAEDKDILCPGRVLIAPGGKQLSIKKLGGIYKVEITDAPPVNRHKPSVDVLFSSMAKVVKKKQIGIILTGMGADGAKGLLEMKMAGAQTIAQDEASCAVFGMPREAIRKGAADMVLSLKKIPEKLISILSKSQG